MNTKKERKAQLFQKTIDTFRNYNKFLVVRMDNVTSSQLQECKKAWRGRGEFLIRKNTAMKKALGALLQEDPKYEEVMDLVQGNVAFLFTNEEVRPLKEIIENNQRKAYAKTGAIAQRDLWIEPMITAMDSEKAPYFQALGISYKITKSKLEIISRIKVLEEGAKIGPAQANLLSILDIQPFVYMMKIQKIYEGGCYYEPWIIDLGEEDIAKSYREIIGQVAALSLGTGTITKASVPYNMINAAKDAIAISLATDFKIKEAAAFQ